MTLFQLPQRYQDQKLRFEGGHAYVSVYRDTDLDRLVAIKYMKSVVDANTLRKELSALRDLNSRHVVQVYDLLFSDKSRAAALIQEYVPGKDLSEYAKDNHSEKDYINTLWQLSCGLAEIHGQRKVHRDIKPSNAKFDAEGILKILDFGLVNQLPKDDETVNARGTRYYLAPELYGVPPIKVNAAIDVYAYGVTTWWLLSGGTLPKALRQDPPQSDFLAPSLATAPVKLPDLIVTLLDQTLKVNPKNRPAMSIVRDVLQRHLLKGSHILTLAWSSGKRVLKSIGATATLRAGSISVTIRYDGLSFLIESIEGEVFINNTPAQVGQSMPGSCVITLGSGGGWSDRSFVSANISNPEVVL